jgi:hypothetical protein
MFGYGARMYTWTYPMSMSEHRAPEADEVVDRLRDALAALRAILSPTDTAPVLPDDIRQELMRTAVSTYATAWQDCRASVLADPADITATEAVIAASGLIKALNIELFELAMWQTQTAG